jgi:hypothetical protein
MEDSMRRLAAVLGLLVATAFAPLPAGARAETPAGDTYYPLAKGAKWTYNTDYADDTELVHEVIAAEKVGGVDCFIVEHKTVSPALGTRMMRKEWLAADADGVMIHKLQRGRSEMDVVKPFYKVKNAMRKDEEWRGDVKAEENPPQYTIRVEEEADVEVPAGKYKAWKLHVKIESGTRHGAESTEWYVKNVGLVKADITIKAAGEEFTMVTELKKFEPGK